MASNEVCFLEEIAISNMYGTESEKKIVAGLISHLINDSQNIEKIVELAVIIEEIKRREITHMDWNCCFCDKCERFHNCRIKWYRGERQMPQYCCSYCQEFDRCLARFQKQEKSRRIVSEIFIININGNDIEVEAARKIVNNITDLDCLIKLAVLSEEIRARELSKMKWACCPQCTKYNSCRIKWHRGEQGASDQCCSYCQQYQNCLSRFNMQSEKEARIVEEIFVVNLYGNDAEIIELKEILNTIDNPQTIIRLAVLSEKIRERELAKMEMCCCLHCKFMDNCDINRARSEDGQANNCCSYCALYAECLKKVKKSKIKR